MLKDYALAPLLVSALIGCAPEVRRPTYITATDDPNVDRVSLVAEIGTALDGTYVVTSRVTNGSSEKICTLSDSNGGMLWNFYDERSGLEILSRSWDHSDNHDFQGLRTDASGTKEPLGAAMSRDFSFEAPVQVGPYLVNEEGIFVADISVRNRRAFALVSVVVSIDCRLDKLAEIEYRVDLNSSMNDIFKPQPKT